MSERIEVEVEVEPGVVVVGSGPTAAEALDDVDAQLAAEDDDSDDDW